MLVLPCNFQLDFWNRRTSDFRCQQYIKSKYIIDFLVLDWIYRSLLIECSQWKLCFFAILIYVYDVAFALIFSLSNLSSCSLQYCLKSISTWIGLWHKNVFVHSFPEDLFSNCFPFFFLYWQLTGPQLELFPRIKLKPPDSLYSQDLNTFPCLSPSSRSFI